MWENDVVLDNMMQFLKKNNISMYIFTPPLTDADIIIDKGLRSIILQPEFNTYWSDFIATLQPKKLYLLTDDFQCSYVALCLPDSDEIMLCGPVTFERVLKERLMESIQRFQIPAQLQDFLYDYYMHIPFISMQSFYQIMFVQLAEYLFGKDSYELVRTNPSELSFSSDYYNNYFRVPDEPFSNISIVENRYKLENAFIDAVITGNEEKALKSLTNTSLSEDLPNRLGSELRDLKDYTITLNTLLRKAVERSGVHPIHIDNLSNQTIKNIENLTSVEKCYNFWRKLIHDYCNLVHEYTFNEYSSLIQKALTCISTDLTADLSLSSLANHLSVNASYLSSQFKKELGVSLTDYVNNSRISRAKQLLLETDLPIKSIAEQCGVADVYYFGRLFKKITGTSPTAYRKKARS